MCIIPGSHNPITLKRTCQSPRCKKCTKSGLNCCQNESICQTKNSAQLYCFYVKSVSDSQPLSLHLDQLVQVVVSNLKWSLAVLHFCYDHRDLTKMLTRCLYDNGIPTTAFPGLLLAKTQLPLFLTCSKYAWGENAAS